MSDESTVFLSHLFLNPRSNEVQAGLENCHALHQTIMRGFPTVPSDEPRKALDVLYRPELHPHTRALTVLVQSSIEPNWDSLGGEWSSVLAIETGKPVVKRVDAAYRSLSTDQRLRFRLRANPTKRVHLLNQDGSAVLRDDGRRKLGPRVPLVNTEEQLAWLARKAEDGGFRIDSVRPGPDRFGSNRQLGWRGQRNRDRNIVLDAVLFDGLLTITDTASFQRILVAGLGSGKAFGFGLLSIAPARAAGG